MLHTEFNNTLARKFAMQQVNAVIDVLPTVDFNILYDGYNEDNHTDQWYDEYNKICDAIAGEDAPEIPDEIEPFFANNDERLNKLYHDVIVDIVGSNTDLSNKLNVVFNIIEQEGI